VKKEKRIPWKAGDASGKTMSSKQRERMEQANAAAVHRLTATSDRLPTERYTTGCLKVGIVIFIHHCTVGSQLEVEFIEVFFPSKSLAVQSGMVHLL
jgi:hypothetical protein